MPNSEQYRPALNAQQTAAYVAAEYEAGYEARRQGLAEYKTATCSWRAGWQDAERELIVSLKPV